MPKKTADVAQLLQKRAIKPKQGLQTFQKRIEWRHRNAAKPTASLYQVKMVDVTALCTYSDED